MSAFRTLRSLIAAPIFALCALPAAATCAGTNLLASLSADESAALDAAMILQPYAEGNLWQARRNDQSVTLLGTYHLSDPRHAPIMARVTPLIGEAKVLLVEAGPAEEAALKETVARDPSLLFLPDGPSLMQQLSKDEWEKASRALAARNIPAMMGAKMQPWYLATVLAIPPCAIAAATEGNGLDKLVIEAADAQGLPVVALEPFTTMFAIFEQLTAEQQIDMLRSTLMMDGQADDYSATLADAFFDEDIRRTWEFMRIKSAEFPGYDAARADAEFALMGKVLMDDRNISWIPVIEQAAAEGPVFAAFGALHLAGENGVLNLLAKDGWQVTRLSMTP